MNTFDSNEAAIYLGLSRHTLRKYVRRKLIRPCKTVGRAYLFASEELDRYRKDRRPVGKPRRS